MSFWCIGVCHCNPLSKLLGESVRTSVVGVPTNHSPFQYSEPMKTMNKRNWGPPTTLIVRNVVVTEKEPTKLRPKLSERLLSIPAPT
jgi:hypothetical protein